MRKRRKPRLFSFSREIEMSHFDEWITDPDHLRLLGEVVDAFLEMSTSRRITPYTLGAIVTAARHADDRVRGVGVTRLAVLCHYFGEAVDEMAKLTEHRNADVRIYAVSALANTPVGVVVPLLTRCLEDRVWTVRKAAAQVGSALVLEEMMPVLATRLATEPDARVRVVVQLALDFQRRHQADAAS
jgi:hypothetical protein